MSYIPISFNVKSKKVLLIGGGRVALHKLKTIIKFTRNIIVVAPEILPEIENLGVKLIRASYNKKYLSGISLVYACTNDRDVNKTIKRDANKKSILVNVADDKDLCDFISPAVYKKGNMVISVSSQGSNVKSAVAVRDQIKKFLK